MIETDLLVIGGGINGAGIAADAACRGLRVIVCEKNDLASGTSSASTKLIHGGIRYLEQARLHLVYQSLKERAILLQRAPHLVHTLKFIFPCSSRTRSRWQLNFGFKLYDWLSIQNDLERSQALKLDHYSPLKNMYQHAFSYYDAYTDDARLVILNALLARQKGAHILTHTECIKAESKNGFWFVKLKKNKMEFQVKAKVVVNASGSAVKKLLETVFSIESNTPLSLVKGSHIVIPKLYEENVAYTLPALDSRIIFAIPYENNYTLIGTTDVTQSSTHLSTEISSEEINYLIKNINHYFSQAISPEQIVWSYSGLRALAYSEQEHPSLISREAKLEVDVSQGAVVLSLYGGKLTSYRALAEKTVNALASYFPDLKNCNTRNLILPGGNLKMDFENFNKKLASDYPHLDPYNLQRLAKSYGQICYQILRNVVSNDDLGINFGGGLYQREVDYLMEYEWASCREDILWRRGKLGLKSDEIKMDQLKNYMEEKLYERT